MAFGVLVRDWPKITDLFRSTVHHYLFDLSNLSSYVSPVVEPSITPPKVTKEGATASSLIQNVAVSLSMRP